MIIRVLEKCCDTKHEIRPDITLTAAVLAVGTVCGIIGIAETITVAVIQYLT
ncbi:MAG: hypothetical protein HPY44_00155 [Armatimonadetes bacterium]|nr:hypothetical protein [Armatimonadota bacterium]